MQERHHHSPHRATESLRTTTTSWVEPIHRTDYQHCILVLQGKIEVPLASIAWSFSATKRVNSRKMIWLLLDTQLLVRYLGPGMKSIPEGPFPVEDFFVDDCAKSPLPWDQGLVSALCTSCIPSVLKTGLLLLLPFTQSQLYQNHHWIKNKFVPFTLKTKIACCE